MTLGPHARKGWAAANRNTGVDPSSTRESWSGSTESRCPCGGGIVEPAGASWSNAMEDKKINVEAAGIEPLWQQIHNLVMAFPLTCACPWPARRSTRSADTQTVTFSGLRVGFRAYTLHLAGRPLPKQRFRVVGSTLPGKVDNMLLSSTYPPSQPWLRAWSTDLTGSRRSSAQAVSDAG